ncbi:hypothetical protein [Mesorhizobium sp. KR9-304]|uniref:hypothetical protein n=1 Tax=Mesorhizobium sp. KR9-304 TaxID=3156614 RepID=UPI0032B4826F
MPEKAGPPPPFNIKSNFTLIDAVACPATPDAEPFKRRAVPERTKSWKTMPRNKPNSANILQDEIRKQFGSAGTSRFLRALPGFRVEHKIPERFSNLLAELDRAESSQRGPDRNGHGDW